MRPLFVELRRHHKHVSTLPFKRTISTLVDGIAGSY